MMLSGRSGHFTFGNPGAAYVEAKKAIQKAMWRNQPSNGLKQLLLAHENSTILQINPMFVHQPWMRSLPALNTQQEEAYARATYLNHTLPNIVTLVQGPPGTGKTNLISRVVLNCMKSGMPWLLVAQTQYAVHWDKIVVVL